MSDLRGVVHASIWLSILEAVQSKRKLWKSQKFL